MLANALTVVQHLQQIIGQVTPAGHIHGHGFPPPVLQARQPSVQQAGPALVDQLLYVGQRRPSADIIFTLMQRRHMVTTDVTHRPGAPALRQAMSGIHSHLPASAYRSQPVQPKS
ncbi:hypothetical protein CQZ97_12850 [Pseudomonas poae]|nr:hypothetical protein CQZ97_12850 [Pseudomonas poae]